MYPDNQPQPQGSGIAGKLGIAALIIGGLTVLSCLGCFGALVLLGDRSGVRGPHEMESYAQEELETKSVLRTDEEMIAYFDDSMATDGSSAYIITDQRALHFGQSGTAEIPLTAIVEITSKDAGMGMWAYTIISSDGDAITYEIPAWNGIEKWGRALDKGLRGVGNPVEFYIPPKE